MPSPRRQVRHPQEGRFRKIGNEVYLGILLAALLVIVGAALTFGVSYVVNFTNWVALND